MNIQFLCPCGVRLAVPAEMMGKKVKCTPCAAVLLVPQQPAAVPAPLSKAPAPTSPQTPQKRASANGKPVPPRRWPWVAAAAAFALLAGLNLWLLVRGEQPPADDAEDKIAKLEARNRWLQEENRNLREELVRLQQEQPRELAEADPRESNQPDLKIPPKETPQKNPDKHDKKSEDKTAPLPKATEPSEPPKEPEKPVATEAQKPPETKEPETTPDPKIPAEAQPELVKSPSEEPKAEAPRKTGRPFNVRRDFAAKKPQIVPVVHQNELYIAWHAWGDRSPADSIVISSISLDRLAQGQLRTVHEVASHGTLVGFTIDPKGVPYVLTARAEELPLRPQANFAEEVHKQWRKNVVTLYAGDRATDLNSPAFTLLQFYGLTNGGSGRLAAGPNHLGAVET